MYRSSRPCRANSGWSLPRTRGGSDEYPFLRLDSPFPLGSFLASKIKRAFRVNRAAAILKRRDPVAMVVRCLPEVFMGSSSRLSSFSSSGRAHGMTNSCSGCLTVRTGQVALRTTFSATLPMSTCARPVRPCVPMTIRSTFSSLAVLMIS